MDVPTTSSLFAARPQERADANVGGALLPVPQPVAVDGDADAESEPLAKSSFSVADALRTHALLALLVALLGVALVAAIATLCCALLRTRRNQMHYRQLQMPTVTTLVETEKEKERARASVDSASLESASLAEAELQLINQMQLQGFEVPSV